MLTAKDLQVGDVGFTRIRRGSGVLVWLAQWLLVATSWKERKLHHVFVVTEVKPTMVFRIVQAVPGGAEEVLVGEDHLTSDYVYLRPAYEPGQGGRVATAARKYVGTPYSFLDYLAILGLHLGIDNGPIRRYVRSTGHQICSQLADQALADAGVHVFDDGRWPGDVMPVQLYRGLLAMPGTIVVGSAS